MFSAEELDEDAEFLGKQSNYSRDSEEKIIEGLSDNCNTTNLPTGGTLMSYFTDNMWQHTRGYIITHTKKTPQKNTKHSVINHLRHFLNTNMVAM